MNNRAAYFIQILEKIGTPLMEAVIARGTTETEETAKHVAEILTQSVQASIDLGPLIEIEKLGEDADAARVSLAAISSNMLAEYYRAKGKMPGAGDVKRMIGGLQAVKSFSENFTATKEASQRIASLKADGSPVDPLQEQLQYLKAFAPVIDAIGEFAFGEPEQKMISDVAKRLTGKASDLTKKYFASAKEGDQKHIERGVLETLTQLYATCHYAEITRLSAPDAKKDAAVSSLEKVWADFDWRVVLLESLAASMVPGMKIEDAQKPSAASTPVPPVSQTPAEAPLPPAAPAAPEKPPETPPAGEPVKPDTPQVSENQAPQTPPQSSSQSPQQETPPQPPAQEAPAEQPPAAPQQSSNPMSAFIKKPSGDSAPQSPAEAPPPPAAPAAPEKPPETPPAGEPVKPDTPSAPPPSQDSGSGSDQAGDSAQGGGPPPSGESSQPSGSPMSFFKKKDDNGEDE
jgi:hypothetical protein